MVGGFHHRRVNFPLTIELRAVFAADLCVSIFMNLLLVNVDPADI
jgi:hypothetical protein